jgi:hypothetical protein
MTETEWAAFMARLQELPPMGSRPSENTTNFWREIDTLAETLPPQQEAPHD